MYIAIFIYCFVRCKYKINFELFQIINIFAVTNYVLQFKLNIL